MIIKKEHVFLLTSYLNIDRKFVALEIQSLYLYLKGTFRKEIWDDLFMTMKLHIYEATYKYFSIKRLKS